MPLLLLDVTQFRRKSQQQEHDAIRKVAASENHQISRYSRRVWYHRR
jgi:hypothetical protein